MKKLLLTVALVAGMSIFAGCGSSSEKETKVSTEAKKTFDASQAKALGSELSGSSVFADELSEVNSDIVANYLKLTSDDYTSIIGYKSSGATAEEITIVECKDGKDISEQIDSYLETQKTTYKDYNAEEVTKLDNAIIAKKGNFLILVVANDADGAKKIVDKY